jgi:hypothetical protein
LRCAAPPCTTAHTSRFPLSKFAFGRARGSSAPLSIVDWFLQLSYSPSRRVTLSSTSISRYLVLQNLKPSRRLYFPLVSVLEGLIFSSLCSFNPRTVHQPHPHPTDLTTKRLRIRQAQAYSGQFVSLLSCLYAHAIRLRRRHTPNLLTDGEHDTSETHTREKFRIDTAPFAPYPFSWEPFYIIINFLLSLPNLFRLRMWPSRYIARAPSDDDHLVRALNITLVLVANLSPPTCIHINLKHQTATHTNPIRPRREPPLLYPPLYPPARR